MLRTAAPMWDSRRRDPTVPPWALAAALAGGAGAVALFLAYRRRSMLGVGPSGGSGGAMDRDKLVAILRELARQFFHVCRDVAAIAKSVRGKVEASNIEITDEKLREQLVRQCKVFERLRDIQAEVASKFGCTPEDMEAMQRHAAHDAEVRAYADGFKVMLNEALGGEAPVLPNVQIPAVLTEEKALQIHAEVHTLEAKRVTERLSAGKYSLAELGEVLGLAHRDAWEQAFANNAALGVEPEVYHSAVAIYTRSEDFEKELKKLDDAHQQKMVKLFQRDGKNAQRR